MNPLDRFHPIVQQWFTDQLGRPTEIQRRAWPRIAAGEHALVVAPTGSGKTLTAFLWALDNLLTGTWESGAVRVLYVSPLRALNTDVRRNLSDPLEQLRELFAAAGEGSPVVRVATRSGDTPTSERRKMIRHPPEILITTPESLNILLTSRSGRTLLGSIETVILDEIHAVASSKRGAHLMTAVERLVRMSGEFQRIALSATVKPLPAVAELVGGYRLERTDPGSEAAYLRRRVTTVVSKEPKSLELSVRYNTGSDGSDDTESTWRRQVEGYKRHIRRNRSTLLFANSRRLAEKVTRMINEGEPDELAYSHHGSLSREVREIVERRLKNGELKAIVATSSLELGIDIGSLDEVLMIRSPRSIASTVQRVGRAGHSVGTVSRGALYPTDGRDLLDAAVVARATVAREIEESRIISCPLDVLAQVVLSMTVAEEWAIDELFEHLRCATPWHRLERRQFDLVLEMLAGRYAESQVRDLRPRIALDRLRGTVRARRGVERLLYMSGGTIADRGYFALRVHDTKAKLGELDEEFVWERSIGDRFNFGAQSWQIERITHNDVLVRPTRSGGSLAPFWRADRQDRSFSLGARTLELLATAEHRIADREWPADLARDYCLDHSAATGLVEFLQEQLSHTRHLPTPTRIVAERFRDRSAAHGAAPQLVIHTFWGGTVNRPLAMALKAAWREKFGADLETYHDDSSLLVKGDRELSGAELLAMVPPGELEALLRAQLERTGYFGARFRVAAAISLLLPKAGFRQRTPLWVSRQRSKKLLESVAPFGDFPMLLETWRTCLQDEMELDHLAEQLTRVGNGEIEVYDLVTETPSPLCSGLIWLHTNEQMYATDEPIVKGSGLADDVVRDLVFGVQLRPRLPPDLVRAFESKIRRLKPGYLPRDEEELLEWLKERLFLDFDEWQTLLGNVGESGDFDIDAIADRVVKLRLPGARIDLVVAIERLSWLLAALGPETTIRTEFSKLDGTREQFRSEWRLGDVSAHPVEDQLSGVLTEVLSFAGPVKLQWLRDRLGCELKVAGGGGIDDSSELGASLATLQETHRVVIDQLTEGVDYLEVCDRENLEILLRWLRQSQRPRFEPIDLSMLPLWLATHQGVARRASDLEGLQQRLEQLFAFPASAALWEREFLPARLETYYSSWLDSLFHDSPLVWVGCGNAVLTFLFDEDLELLGASRQDDNEEVTALFPSREGHFLLEQLAAHGASGLAETSERVWRLAWQGQVSNDGFAAIRKGLVSKFRFRGEQRSGPRPRNRWSTSGSRWSSGRTRLHGRWFVLPAADGDIDLLDREELAKERARVVLRRYGIVFRELLARELPDFRWKSVFRTLRLMELSGEIVAGYFFTGIRGLQFMSKSAFEKLRNGLPRDRVFCLNAADPASLCGIEIEDLQGDLPARRPGNQMVYHGSRVVLVSEQNGRRLTISVAPADPRLSQYLAAMGSSLTREIEPRKSIEVEEINGQSALGSPYEEALEEVFSVTRDAHSIRLWRRFGG